MELGVSSSCFYPSLIEDSVRSVGESGAKTGEIFFNSLCELSGDIFKELCSIREYYNINIRSIHPFTSGFETIMFFSDYGRRTDDCVEFYKKYFDVAHSLGAEMIVLHGGRIRKGYTPEIYAENYFKLHDAARKDGLYFAQENVNNCLCSDPRYMKCVADLIGDDFRLVLDIKQCRRAGQNEFDFIELLGDKIAQVHLSDASPNRDCLAPGKGDYNFKKLFDSLKTHGYDKTAVIELYRDSYEKADEVKASLNYLNNIV